MRVGVLGGTFDPIHVGHLTIAEEARVRLGLEQVVFVPTGQPWLKPEPPVAPSHHRYNMVCLAVASSPHFRTARNEIDRPGLTYTVDTLSELQDELGQDAELYFILGQDALEQFHQWKDPERVLELCHLAVVSRPGRQDAELLQDLFSRYPQAADKLKVLPTPLIDVSGTEVRQKATRGNSLRHYVPDAVEEYIRRHRLYQADHGWTLDSGPDGAVDTVLGKPSERYR